MSEFVRWLFSISFIPTLAVILLTSSVLIVKDWGQHKGEVKRDTQMGRLEKGLHDVVQQTTLIGKALPTLSDEWKTVDASNAVSAIDDVVFLIFKGRGSAVTGYVKGTGVDEKYPFDTAINNTLPVAVKIKTGEPKIEYMVISPKGQKAVFDMYVVGVRLAIR
jgi:hypothetical protein